MAWTTPGTATAGEVLTAAFWNEQVRDNSNFLYTPPMVRCKNSTGQSLTSGANRLLTFDSEDFDTDSMHSTATNTGRITFNTAGIYIVSLFVALTGSVNCNVWIEFSGTRIATTNPNSSGSGYNTQTLYKFAANDYIEAYVFPANNATTDTSTAFSAAWIGKN